MLYQRVTGDFYTINSEGKFTLPNSYVYVDNYPLFLYSIIKRGKCLCYIACVFDKH